MKGRIIQPGTKNLTPTQKRSTDGFKRYMPLREFQGRGPNGEHIGTPVWHDTHANKSYAAGPGWSQPPPALPSGDVGREPRCQLPSRAYREKYKAIFGHD